MLEPILCGYFEMKLRRMGKEWGRKLELWLKSRQSKEPIKVCREGNPYFIVPEVERRLIHASSFCLNLILISFSDLDIILAPNHWDSPDINYIFCCC